MHNTRPTNMTLRSLMNGHATAEILNLFRLTDVVRKLTVADDCDTLEIDAITETVVFPLDTPIVYEPWCMDRGSMLVEHPTRGTLKLCTELDVIRFPDGSQKPVEVF